MAPDISDDNVVFPQLPVFYFSYAYEDRSERLTKFFLDLSLRVSENMGLDPDDPVGFRDTEGITAGERWQEKLVDALQASRVLVAVYSENYFASENCGREILFYLEREKMLAKANDKSNRHSRIVPVLWSGAKLFSSLPHDAKQLVEIYYALPSEPDYSDRGLAEIVETDAVTYHRVVDALSDLIVARFKDEPLPQFRKPPAFLKQPSLFPSEDPHIERPKTDAVSKPYGDPALPEDSPVDVDYPTLVFRLVVARELEIFELEDFNRVNIEQAVKQYSDRTMMEKDAGDAATDFSRRRLYARVQGHLQKTQPGIEPNPLWLAWTKTVRAERIQNLEEWEL